MRTKLPTQKPKNAQLKSVLQHATVTPMHATLTSSATHARAGLMPLAIHARAGLMPPATHALAGLMLLQGGYESWPLLLARC